MQDAILYDTRLHRTPSLPEIREAARELTEVVQAVDPLLEYLEFLPHVIARLTQAALDDIQNLQAALDALEASGEGLEDPEALLPIIRAYNAAFNTAAGLQNVLLDVYELEGQEDSVFRVIVSLETAVWFEDPRDATAEYGTLSPRQLILKATT